MIKNFFIYIVLGLAVFMSILLVCDYLFMPLLPAGTRVTRQWTRRYMALSWEEQQAEDNFYWAWEKYLGP